MRTRVPGSPNQHKVIVRRVFKEVWTDSNFGHVTELLAPQLTYHFRGKIFEQVPESLIQIVERWKQAFPDLRFQVEELVAEGDLVSARLVYRGTHQGEWKGIPPTGRKVEVNEMMFFRFEEGRIVEVWEVADEYSQRQQLVGPDD